MSVLEIVDKSPSQSRRIRGSSCGRDNMILRQFNPFINTYLFQPFSSKSQLLTDKTIHLYNAKVKTLIAQSSTLYKQYSKMVRSMSKVMNFRSSIILVNNSKLWNMGCRKEELYCWSSKLKCSFLRIICMRISLVNKTAYIPNRIIMLGSVQAVVLRFFSQTLIVVELWKMFFTFLLIAISLLAIQMITLNCVFQKNFWWPFNMVDLLLGMSAAVEPKKLKDRIVFGSLLITFQTYTSFRF